MYRRARLGIGYLPQEASIFRGLTVEQNIMAVLELVEPNRRRRQEQLDSLLDEFRDRAPAQKPFHCPVGRRAAALRDCPRPGVAPIIHAAG